VNYPGVQRSYPAEKGVPRASNQVMNALQRAVAAKTHRRKARRRFKAEIRRELAELGRGGEAC
jgi:hypothetical protein